MSFPSARPWVILALIFILGAVTGSLLTIGLGPHFSPGPPGPQEMRNHWMHHLVWRLHLTDDQQAKIQPILDEAEKNIQDAHREDVARIFGYMQAANAKIKPYLNGDQQAELQRMESERERMFSGHMHGPGRPGPMEGPGPDEDGRPPGPPPPPGPSPTSMP